MRITRLREYLAKMWRPILLYGALFGSLGAMLFVRLGTLVGGYSVAETQTYQSSLSLHNIFEHPLNAPFTLVTHGFTYLTSHSYLLPRLTAAIVGLATLVVVCWLLHRWYGTYTAVVGTFLLGTSAGFLHSARLGMPDVMLLGLVVLVACAVWLKRTGNPIALLLTFGCASLLLYVPGMVWFILAGMVWQWRTIDRVFKHHLLLVSVGGLVVLAAMAPLGLAIYHDPTVAKVLVGLPADGWPAPLAVLKNLAEVPLAIFARSPENPQGWLGQLPILDVFATTMLLLGLYVCYKHIGLMRSKLIAFALLLGVPLIALGGAVTTTVLLPFLYMLVAIGIVFVWDRWAKVFPRNPIAKAVAIGLIVVTVLMATSFQFRHYFLAWPRYTETKAVFTQPEL